MRKYPIISTDGKEFNVSHIGVNHTASNLCFGGIASSFNGEFDNEDEVCLENGLGDIRYCILGDISEVYKILKNEIRSISPRNIEDYAECVQRTVMRYFGDFSNVKERLSYFPDVDEVDHGKEIGTISSIAHKNAAMCVERAMVAQNLLKEIGIRSVYKMSGVIVNGNEEAHAYNLVSHDGKNYVFDVTIPTVNNGKVSPLVCEIPNEVYDMITKPNQDIGYSIELTHYNPLRDRDYSITYDAGRKDIYKVGKTKTK